GPQGQQQQGQQRQQASTDFKLQVGGQAAEVTVSAATTIFSMTNSLDAITGKQIQTFAAPEGARDAAARGGAAGARADNAAQASGVLGGAMSGVMRPAVPAPAPPPPPPPASVRIAPPPEPKL